MSITTPKPKYAQVPIFGRPGLYNPVAIRLTIRTSPLEDCFSEPIRFFSPSLRGATIRATDAFERKWDNWFGAEIFYKGPEYVRDLDLGAVVFPADDGELWKGGVKEQAALLRRLADHLEAKG